MSKNASSLVEVAKVSSTPKALSLFSGAGCMDRGFKAAGFEVKAAVEMWKPACETFRANFPGVSLVEGDAADPAVKAKVAEILKDWGIDVVFGGAPCQPFSMLGKRVPKDPRNLLVLEFIKYVGMTRPKVFVMENVEGILSALMRDGLIAIEAIKAAAAGIGYKVEHRVLCAAGYGVPQMRKRVIIVGTRFDVPILFPDPTHGPEGSGLLPYVTVKEAIDDLRDRDEDKAFGHFFTRHSARLMRRIEAVKPGQALYSRKHGYRLTPDGQAATLTNNNGSTVLHYALDRMITPRECARLQGVSDEHVLLGSKNDVGKQVGNAVPPPLAKAVGGAVARMLAAIDAGAPELSPSALAPAPVTPAPDAESLKDEVTRDRKSCVGRINVEKRKIDAAGGRVDSLIRSMGKHIDEHIRKARALGESRGDDYLLKALAKDPACRVKKGALYNAWTYHVVRSQMEEKFGRAPDVPMTYFVKVRHNALTLGERRGLLLKAEADKAVTASRLNAMVAEMLKDKGVGRKEPAPDAALVDFARKAFASVTKIAGLLKKGMKPSDDALSFMSKTAEMLARCLKDTGVSSFVPAVVDADAAKGRKAA